MKGKIIIAIISGLFLLAGAIITSPHWFKYFFPEQYLVQENIEPVRTKTTEKEINGNQENSTGTENLVISRIDLSSRDFNIPSYFYFEVTNKGTKIIQDLNITVDLGKSKYQEFDYSKKIPSKIITDSTDKSFVKIIYPEIKENETIEFYALTSAPTFKNIILNASNMTFDKKYTYDDYLISEKDGVSNEGGFYLFLTVILSIVIVVFAIYFTFVIITYLNKVFKIE